ncbi:MAG TPA: helix-turn-helix transcriptional regulator [Chloroflexota bacterium]|nr:helix-turn-helix transcriptional regulator [Chloroflexota bacterium]
MKGEVLKGHLDLLLLAALQGEAAHGYAIAEALRARSGGVFDLPEGTIYPALHRLEAAGLVESHWQSHAGRRRRVYALTASGTAALATQRATWERFVAGVNAVLSEVSCRETA